MLRTYIKYLQKTQLSTGYSLIELMAASLLTLMVVGVSGFALVTILRETEVANATGQIQTNANRAADFISEEIRNADRIETSLATADLQTNAPTYYSTHGSNRNKIPVLALKIPSVPERVVYYLQPAGNNSIWRPPYVLRRFGPGFKLDGDYDRTQLNPQEWDGDALIDGISDTVTNTACLNPGRTRLPSANADVKGFFVCVQPDGQLAEVHLTTTSQNEIGHLASNNATSRYNQKMNYTVETLAYAKADYSGASGLSFPDYALYDYGIVPEDSGNVSATLSILAGLTCNTSVSPGNSFSAGDTVTFSVDCIGISPVSSNTNDVVYITDGDNISDIDTNNSSLLETQLNSYLDGDTFSLQDNEILYLLDLDPNDGNAYHDDAYVLITINP